MKRPSIDWPTVLSSYPGQTIGEKIHYAKNERTFPELASDLRVSIEAIKTLYYRGSTSLGRRRITSKERPNYAAMVGVVIEDISHEKGMTPDECREWIKTRAGERKLEKRCKELKIPLFRCRRVQ